MKRIFLFIFSLIFIPFYLFAQDNIGLKFFGLSLHPKGEKDNAFLMPRKLDENAYFVLNIGGIASYEKFIKQDIVSIKIAGALYSDCAAQLGGFAHIGFRGRIFQKNKHRLFGGIGPTLVFRENWENLQGYTNLNRFKSTSNDQYQYLFLWYGGEFEYKYSFNEKINLDVSFIPGYPDLMSLSFGVSYSFK